MDINNSKGYVPYEPDENAGAKQMREAGDAARNQETGAEQMERVQAEAREAAKRYKSEQQASLSASLEENKELDAQIKAKMKANRAIELKQREKVVKVLEANAKADLEHLGKLRKDNIPKYLRQQGGYTI